VCPEEEITCKLGAGFSFLQCGIFGRNAESVIDFVQRIARAAARGHLQRIEK